MSAWNHMAGPSARAGTGAMVSVRQPAQASFLLLYSVSSPSSPPLAKPWVLAHLPKARARRVWWVAPMGVPTLAIRKKSTFAFVFPPGFPLPWEVAA